MEPTPPPPFASLPAELLRLIAALPLDCGTRSESAASAACYRSEAFAEDLPAAAAPEPVHRKSTRTRRLTFAWLPFPTSYRPQLT